MTLPEHINNPGDLITPYEARTHGFLEQALRKVEASRGYVQDGLRLQRRLQQVRTPAELVNDASIRGSLVAAIGFSQKAANNLTPQDLDDALIRVVEEMQEEVNDDWRDELLFRFLLTKGDSLGGKMRNTVGALAQAKFAAAIIRGLEQYGIESNVVRNAKAKIQIIRTPTRIMAFDRRTPFFSNNIDVLLLKDTNHVSTVTSLIGDKSAYLACGELKGGIDPAGADEHWKTATQALNRIHQYIDGNLPVFFAGAAIEATMAGEIFDWLQTGRLAHAANLTIPVQVADLVNWLVGL